MQVGGVRISADDGPSKCYGDSGGPTYMNVAGQLHVIGVTSRSYDGHEDCDTAGIDTRADAFIDWIEAEMQRACDDGIRRCDGTPTNPPTNPDPQPNPPTDPDPTPTNPDKPSAPSPTTPTGTQSAKSDTKSFSRRAAPAGCSTTESNPDFAALLLVGIAGLFVRRRSLLRP